MTNNPNNNFADPHISLIRYSCNLFTITITQFVWLQEHDVPCNFYWISYQKPFHVQVLHSDHKLVSFYNWLTSSVHHIRHLHREIYEIHLNTMNKYLVYIITHKVNGQQENFRYIVWGGTKCKSSSSSSSPDMLISSILNVSVSSWWILDSFLDSGKKFTMSSSLEHKLLHIQPIPHSFRVVFSLQEHSFHREVE